MWHRANIENITDIVKNIKNADPRQLENIINKVFIIEMEEDLEVDFGR